MQRKSSEMSPKILPNGTQNAPRSDSFRTLEPTLAPILTQVPLGEEMGCPREPKGSQNASQNQRTSDKTS